MMVTKIGIIVSVVALLSGMGMTMIVKPGHEQVKLESPAGIVKPGHTK